MANVSPPSSPASFHSAYSVLPAAHATLHEMPVDVKNVPAIVTHSRKSSEGSIMPPRAPEIAHGKKRQVYALETTGEGSGSALAAMGAEGTDDVVNALVLARIRDLEKHFGGPALIGGVPLLGVMQHEGVTQSLTFNQDSYEPPKVHVARPEDLLLVDEMVEAPKPAVDNQAFDADGSPAPPRPPPSPAGKTGPTLDDLQEYLEYDGDLGELTDREFESALNELKEPATAYGRLKREQDLIARKERKRAEVRISREKKWRGKWEEWAEEAGDEREKEMEAEKAGIVPEKKKAAVKVLWDKYAGKVGGKVVKVVGKIGEGLMEHAIEGAIEGAGGF
ncbi:hypothetical protein CALCODRAFT_505746 [Calocera cornea HHB12733]|uniref:Uncharacterized protein n=1 Tax=Calocera cornea HHB12733 TaxID=1353952 RepID=A0A165JR31_9BASI|nr:hypothetical protein CALCODRAFT_505746 [Calocera cornea HHB12733]